jgi:hypothetical protein
MLARLEIDRRQLEPQDPMHRRLALVILNQFERLSRMRWKLIEEAHTSISMPFYIVLAFWLVIVFASFGLSAPRNVLSYITILLAALSIASVIFVILDWTRRSAASSWCRANRCAMRWSSSADRDATASATLRSAARKQPPEEPCPNS